MLIILGLVLAGLIVIIGAYRYLRLWLTWMDSTPSEEQQVSAEVKKQPNEKPSQHDIE